MLPYRLSIILNVSIIDLKEILAAELCIRCVSL